MDSWESTSIPRDRRSHLRVLPSLQFYADGIDRPDITAHELYILEHASRYWIVQGDYYVYI